MKPPADEVRDTRGRVSWYGKTITSVVILLFLYVVSTGPVAAIAKVHYGSNAGTLLQTYLAPLVWCAARSEAMRRFQTTSETRCTGVYFSLVLWWHTAPPESSGRDLFCILRDAPEALACGSALNENYCPQPPTPNP